MQRQISGSDIASSWQLVIDLGGGNAEGQDLNIPLHVAAEAMRMARER